MEGADHGFDHFAVGYIVRQVVVDFSKGQVAALFTHFDQGFKLVAAQFEFFNSGVGRAEVSRVDQRFVFGLGAATTLGHDHQVGFFGI